MRNVPCIVSRQIADYCDQKEAYCPECDSTMTMGEGKEKYLLTCDNEECGHVIDTEPDLDI